MTSFYCSLKYGNYLFDLSELSIKILEIYSVFGCFCHDYSYKHDIPSRSNMACMKRAQYMTLTTENSLVTVDYEVIKDESYC